MWGEGKLHRFTSKISVLLNYHIHDYRSRDVPNTKIVITCYRLKKLRALSRGYDLPTYCYAVLIATSLMH